MHACNFSPTSCVWTVKLSIQYQDLKKYHSESNWIQLLVYCSFVEYYFIDLFHIIFSIWINKIFILQLSAGRWIPASALIVRWIMSGCESGAAGIDRKLGLTKPLTPKTQNQWLKCKSLSFSAIKCQLSWDCPDYPRTSHNQFTAPLSEKLYIFIHTFPPKKLLLPRALMGILFSSTRRSIDKNSARFC